LVLGVFCLFVCFETGSDYVVHCGLPFLNPVILGRWNDLHEPLLVVYVKMLPCVTVELLKDFRMVP
jgi:hypothetical protein